MIRHGDLVTFHFTMSNTDGLVINTSGEDATRHVCGAHTVVPGLEDDAGEPMPMWLVAMTDTHAFFDCNHPLAGVTLHYMVTIVDSRPARMTEKRRESMGAEAGQ